MKLMILFLLTLSSSVFSMKNEKTLLEFPCAVSKVNSLGNMCNLRGDYLVNTDARYFNFKYKTCTKKLVTISMAKTGKVIEQYYEYSLEKENISEYIGDRGDALQRCESGAQRVIDNIQELSECMEDFHIIFDKCKKNKKEEL